MNSLYCENCLDAPSLARAFKVSQGGHFILTLDFLFQLFSNQPLAGFFTRYSAHMKW